MRMMMSCYACLWAVIDNDDEDDGNDDDGNDDDGDVDDDNEL